MTKEQKSTIKVMLRDHKQYLDFIDGLKDSLDADAIRFIVNVDVDRLPDDKPTAEQMLAVTDFPVFYGKAVSIAIDNRDILRKRAVFNSMAIFDDGTASEVFRSADLRYAAFLNTTLNCVSFEGANLSHAKIKYSCFDNCVFDRTVLDSSKIHYSHFTYDAFIKTSFKNVDSDCVTFQNGNFYECDFTDMRTKNDSTSHFTKCFFLDCIDGPHVSMACPDTGSFIGWKKGILLPHGGNCLIKLEIPEDARRSSSVGVKCRCDKAKVLDITSLDGSEHYGCALSMFDSSFVYKVGEVVTPTNEFDPNRWNECAGGIHFFVDKDEAISY